MIFRYLGYLISIILATCSVGLFFVAIYVRYKYADALRPTRKSLGIGLKYSIFSMLSFFSAALVFFITVNGFSWEIVVIFGGIMIVGSIMLFVDYLINRKTAEYLHRRNISLFSLWKDNSIKNIFRDVTHREDVDKASKE